jgi:hypothetical protein
MRKLINVLLVITAIAVSGAAMAKEDDESGATGKEETKEDVSKLSDGEMTGRTEGILAKLRDVRKYVQNLLDQARKAKDIIKITCLNDKLTQINVNIRTYEDRMQSLSNAIKIGDKAARNHEFNVLTVLEQKIMNLRMEADTCIGEAEGYLGKTEVTVTTPKGMAQMDPTTVIDIGIEIFDRPPPASAFQ